MEPGAVQQGIDVAAAVRRHDERRRARMPYEDKWDQIAPMVRPIREEFSAVRDEAGFRGVRNYDSTGPTALDEAGAAIYSMMTSADNIWAPVEFESRALREDPAAARWLEGVNEVLFRTFDPGVSNFYTEAPEAILDCIAFGPGAFYSARPPGADYFIDQALPLVECFAQRDAFGALSAFDRRYSMSRFAIRDQFPRAPLPPAFIQRLNNHPDERVEVLHTVWREPGATGARRFTSAYILLEHGKPLLLQKGGYDEMPFFYPGWSWASGEAYPRGRGEFALADAQILSEMGRTALVQGQRVAEPPLATHNDIGALVSLEPNAVNAGAIDDYGRQLVQPIQLSGSMPVTLEMQNQRREAIREIFYHSMLSLVGSPTPSVVEILKRDERRDQSMAPNLARLMAQFFAPLILRRFSILMRAGQFEPAPVQAQGGNLRVRFVSPLAKAHRSQKAMATLQTVEAVAQVAAVDPEARFVLNGENAARHIADGFAAPDDVLWSRDEAQERRRAAQEAEQIAATVEQAQIGAQAVDSLARAQAAGRQ